MVTKKFDFDKKFQRKVLCLLFKDDAFSNIVLGTDVLQPGDLDFASIGWLFDKMKKMHQKYGSSPSKDVVIREIEKTDELDDSSKKDLKNLISTSATSVNRSDEEYIKEHLTEFIVYQKTKDALRGSVDLLQKGDFGTIEKSIIQAIGSVGMVNDAYRETQYFSDYEQRISKRFDDPDLGIPTNIMGLDDVLVGGGLKRGELGVILGPTGTGKSFFLIRLGRAALFHRYKVMHISLEMRDDAIADRYDQSFLNLTKPDLYTYEGSKQLRKFMETKGKYLVKYGTNESLIIKSWPMNSVDVFDIKNYIKRKIHGGFIPDLILVDYGDVIKPHTKFPVSVSTRRLLCLSPPWNGQ